jgi:hypothetical protein
MPAERVGKLLAIIAEMADAGRLTAAGAMVLPTAEVASIIDLEPLATDLVIAVSMAVWYLENPGPNMGLWEYYRRRAGAPLENYCVAVDFGQSVDNCAICVMSRSSAPETGAVEPVEPPESPAPPPAVGSPEWRHQVAEGQKALLRAQGFGSSGPLKAIAFSASSTATSGGSRSK